MIFKPIVAYFWKVLIKPFGPVIDFPNWPEFQKWRLLTHDQVKMTKSGQNISFHDFQPSYFLILEKNVKILFRHLASYKALIPKNGAIWPIIGPNDQK